MSRESEMCRNRFAYLLVGGLCLGMAPVQADGAVNPAEGSWQERRLMQPSAKQLERESKGGVFIYDGLEHNTVQRAMDEHFDRIEYMMFTRIHHLPPTGSGPAEIEDDGCE